MAALYRDTHKKTNRSLFLRGSCALLLPLALFACSSGDDAANSEDMDAALLGDGSDPAVTGALEDQIMVDPDLVDGGNGNAALGDGNDGSVPSTGAPGGQAYADAQAAIGGKGMMHAPDPKVVSSAMDSLPPTGNTLGARAEEQKNGKVDCASRLKYEMNWAQKLPDAFALYPRSNVKEAAGVRDGDCDMQVVNFTSSNDKKQIVDYYYTKARRAGFSAEYQIRDGQHVLGGVNSSTDGAYVIYLTPLPDGGTSVDIVASIGG